MMPVHHVPAAGTTFAVHTAGAGRPLVLLHGFPLDHRMWEGQAPLAEHLRLIAPDLRGFGGSRGSTATGIAALADDVAALLDALHVGQPAVICGLSMGGYVAQHLAVRHPAHVAALVLVDTKLEADTPEVREGRADLAAKVGRLGPSILADAMLPRLLAPAPTSLADDRAGIEALLRRTIAAQPVGTIQAALAALGGRPDMTEALRGLRVPTLLVVGAEDAITPPSCLETAARVLAESRLLVVPGAGHMAPLERPAVFNAAVLEFLREALPQGRPQAQRP